MVASGTACGGSVRRAGALWDWIKIAMMAMMLKDATHQGLGLRLGMPTPAAAPRQAALPAARRMGWVPGVQAER